MSGEYWEDRITPSERAQCSRALAKFRASRRGATAQHLLYDSLTANGVRGDEADEIINLELLDLEC